jgi:phosphatidylglycerol---prolipoprotein diacylglyceryl transferase
VISCAFSIAVIWISKRAVKYKMDYKFSLDLTLVFMIGCFIGARLFHVIYERPDIYLKDPLRIFQIWRGGFVYYGGAIGGILACWFFTKAKNESFLKWADLVSPVIAFGYAFGRIGCFLGGCCYGAACDLPWAVTFPEGGDAPAGVPLHPTQLYATIWESIACILILRFEKRYRSTPGLVFFAWFSIHGLGRIIMEAYRDDFRGPEIAGLSVSTVISILIILVSVTSLFRIRRHASASGTL